MRSFQIYVCLLFTLTSTPTILFAQDQSGDDTPTVFTIADGEIQFSATNKWEKVKPRSNMLDAEFRIPKVGGDERDGRLIIMGAGGSVKANIDRWAGQFTTAKGKPVEDFELTETKVAGQSVHLMDISGTFADSMGGPVSPKTKRENYRMLGSVIETEKLGKYFVKLYGPKATIDANSDAFKALIQSMNLPKAKAAASTDKPIVFKVDDGNIEFTATGSWKKVVPRSTMLEAEFEIPKSEGDEKDGRLTMMAAGGSVQANIDRWIGQFKNADGTPLEGIESKTMTVAGNTVHMVDLTGTFAESMGGPVAPKTDRDNYRMLGSIIETGDDFNYFVKFYGPAKTIGDNAKAFEALIKSMKIVD